MKQIWICDTCGQTIHKVDDGWVEWWVCFDGASSTGTGLRLVHHRSACPYGPKGSCQYDENAEQGAEGFTLHDSHLNSFLGTDGLMLLLSMLAEGDLPKEEVLEMIKRVHIPGYEHARFHFERAIAQGVIEPHMPPGYYDQSDINAVLDFVGE